MTDKIDDRLDLILREIVERTDYIKVSTEGLPLPEFRAAIQELIDEARKKLADNITSELEYDLFGHDWERLKQVIESALQQKGSR